MPQRVLHDRRIAPLGRQQALGLATRWGLSFGDGSAPAAASTAASPSLAVPLPPADQEILEAAAQARGLSAASFAADLLHVITSQRLIRAVMDDDR